MRLPSITDVPATGLAPLHARWLAAALGGEIPSEPHATCESCAMLPVSGDARAGRDEVFFNPKTKCCTYLPRLHNFLVGAILADGSPDMAEGRTRVLERIGKKIGVTPLWVGAGGAYRLMYDHGDGLFGHSEAMRCPYYLEGRIGGGCGVWAHRNSICMTWFCKHERGAPAKTFWDSAKELLMAVEENVAVHCLLTLGFEDTALRANFPPKIPRAQRVDTVRGDELDGMVGAARYRALWGGWAGREEKLYRECDAITRDLGWEDVERIGGAGVTLLAELARAAHRAATDRGLPERLEVGNLSVIGSSRDTVRLATYSPYDPVDAPAALLPALSAFDGSRVPNALRRIERDHGLVLHAELVRKLVDYGVLRAPDADALGRLPGSRSPSPKRASPLVVQGTKPAT